MNGHQGLNIRPHSWILPLEYGADIVDDNELPSYSLHPIKLQRVNVPLKTVDVGFSSREMVAEMCATFVQFIFGVPVDPPRGWPSLVRFIEQAIKLSQAHLEVTTMSLVLLWRLRSFLRLVPSEDAIGGMDPMSGHKLFLAALMISHKMANDDTFSNRSWSIVAQSLFTEKTVHYLEFSMCMTLDWRIIVRDEDEDLNLIGDAMKGWQNAIHRRDERSD